MLNYTHSAVKNIYGGLNHRWWYIFIFRVKRCLFNVSLRENYFQSWIEWKIMECKSKRKWCVMSGRILATSKFVSRQRAVFISIQRSYSSPIYILFLLNLAFDAFLFLFLVESLNLRFGSGFIFFASDIFFINTITEHAHTLYRMSSNLSWITYDLHYCPGSKNYLRQNKMMFSPELFIVALKKWMVYVLYIFNLYIYQTFLENWKKWFWHFILL